VGAMRTSDLKQPRPTESRIRIGHHRPDAYERVFRQFIAALKAGDEPLVLEIREELRRLVKDEDRR
jgi:hypothetical protein